MKKYCIYIIIYCFLISSCSTRFDRNSVINDYLSSSVKDTTKEIIIVTEKINPNQIIEIFQGTISENSENMLERDGGVPASLYNDKDWKEMKNTYSSKSTVNSNFWMTNESWNKNNFKMQKITFENYKEVLKKLEKRLYSNDSEIKIFSFSDPIYYKKKKYLVVAVSLATTKTAGFYSSFILIMKKVNGRWVIINKTESNIVS